MLPYTQVNATTRETQELNNNVSRVFSSLYGNPLLNQLTIVKNVVFVNGVDNPIQHKLNKNVTGYVIIKANAAVHVFTSPTTNPIPTASIILRSNADATVDLLFF